MSEKWILSKGVLEDGSQALILTDAAYLSPQARGGREILLALNFPGTYMMQAQDRRDAALDQIASFLADHDGVHVAGITRLGTSYTFLFYLGRGAERGDVPIPASCADIARVWFAYDPQWMEFSSYFPARRGFFKRVAQWWESAFGSASMPPITAAEDASDESVLKALAAAGSDLTRHTDIIFYVYVPTREDADRCCATLWEHGYRAHVGQPLGALPDGTTESRWSVVSHLEAVPSGATLGAARELMSTLASECAGEYDGWQAALVLDKL
jgi:hypothetical protein